MRRISDVIHTVAEQVGDTTRGLWPWSWSSVSGIRIFKNGVGSIRFWPTTNPLAHGTEVNAAVTRSLYRNDNEAGLGAAFAKPIVDISVNFMGLPTAASDNNDLNSFMNECLSDYWGSTLQEAFRDAIRDSKTIVRISKPDIFDPLMTMDEASHCKLEVLAPERVDIERNAANKNIMERALVRHRMVFITDDGDPAQGIDPTVDEHDVIEIIDRDRFRFFDQTTNQWLDDLARPNAYGFVNLLEIFHEWDSQLQSGQSDLETVIPFIQAFHDVLAQGLQAHKYHSTPKVKMKLADVGAFIKANFPSAWDDMTNTIKSEAEISWRGREIIFMQAEDDMGFVEAQSVLGDTKQLAEFLIDCICIASQTPEWAFMRVDAGSANSDRNAQTVPLLKKIEKKRLMFATPVQELLKMMQVINGLIPYRPSISWEVVRVDDAVVEMQALQQLTMALQVARDSGQISDETYKRMIQPYLPAMKSPSREATDAEKNVQPTIPAIPVVAGPQGRNE